MRRDGVTHQTPIDTCCRLAQLSAIVKIDGSIHLYSKGLIKLELKTNNTALARLIVSEIKSLFGLSAEIQLRKNNLNAATQSQIIIEHPQLRTVLEKIGVLSSNRLNFGLPANLLKRPCCKKHFSKGAFLAGGYLNGKNQNAHLEITSSNKYLIDDLGKMLSRSAIDNKTRQKGNYFSIYIKSTKAIIEFLKYIEAADEALQLENSLIIKNIKNQANRLANAETANQNKVIKNAFRQIKDIRLIDETTGLNNLPKGLQEICAARLANPQDSLEELGKKLDPPISKSAVNHRFRRISQVAKG